MSSRYFAASMLLAVLAACSGGTPPTSVDRGHSNQDTSMQVEDVDVTSPALPASAASADRALRYADAAGDNVLLLGQHSTTRSDDDGVVERLTLHVAHHVGTPHASQPFREAWRHTEVIECEGLDFDGRFLDDALLRRWRRPSADQAGPAHARSRLRARRRVHRPASRRSCLRRQPCHDSARGRYPCSISRGTARSVDTRPRRLDVISQ